MVTVISRLRLSRPLVTWPAVSGTQPFRPSSSSLSGMSRLDTKLGGAAGFSMAAWLCKMLAGVADRATLQRDACKKLNLGLLAFGAVGLFAVPGESAFTPLAIPGTLLAMMRVIGGITSFFGWRIGVGNKEIVQELVEGAQSTKTRWTWEKKSKGGVYKWSAVLVAFGIAHSLLTIARSQLDLMFLWSLNYFAIVACCFDAFDAEGSW